MGETGKAGEAGNIGEAEKVGEAGKVGETGKDLVVRQTWTHRRTYIYVEPEAMPLTDLSNLIQGVEGTQHGGTRSGTDKKWHCPLKKEADHKEKCHYHCEIHPVVSW